MCIVSLVRGLYQQDIHHILNTHTKGENKRKNWINIISEQQTQNDVVIFLLVRFGPLLSSTPASAAPHWIVPKRDAFVSDWGWTDSGGWWFFAFCEDIQVQNLKYTFTNANTVSMRPEDWHFWYFLQHSSFKQTEQAFSVDDAFHV